MEALEREEALNNPEEATKGMEGADGKEKPLNNVANLEGYLDGEINDLFEASDMHG